MNRKTGLKLKKELFPFKSNGKSCILSSMTKSVNVSAFVENEDFFYSCSCYSPEHTMHWFVDPESGEIHTEIFLNTPDIWWKRVWVGIKYIFGYKSRYGHWDSFLLRHEDHDRVRKMLAHAEVARRNAEAELSNADKTHWL